MPVIPTYERRVSVTAAAPAARADVGAAGLAFAAGGRAGAALTDAAARLRESDEREAASQAGLTLAQLRADWTQRVQMAKEQAPEGAPGFTDGLLRAFDGDSKRTVEAAPEMVRSYLQQHLLGLRQSIFTAAAPFEAHQRVEKQRRDLGRTVDAGTAALATDPRQFAAVLGEMSGAIAASNLPPDIKAEATTAASRKLAVTALAAQLDRDPAAVEKDLTEGLWDKWLDGDSKLTLMRAAQRKGEQREDAATMQNFGEVMRGDSVPMDSFTKAILTQESGDRDYDKDGKPITSSAGARYRYQVMPATARAPGFGIKPAQDDSPEEFNRVGAEYLAALGKRYGGNGILAAAAYNAGYGMVDDWIAGTNLTGKNPRGIKLGDPRTGAVAAKDWIARIPFAETRNYVTKVMATTARLEREKFSAADLPPERKARVLAAMDRGVADQQAEVERAADATDREREAERQEIVGQLSIGIAEGAVDRTTIDDALTIGTLTPSEHEKMTREIIRRDEQARTDQALVQMAQIKAQIPGALDPTDANDKRGVDLWYQAVLPKIQEKPALEAAFLTRMGFLPDAAAGRIAGALRTGTPDQKAWAADMIERVGRLADGAGLPATDLAFAEMIRTNVRNGIPPGEAVAQAEAAVRVPDAVRQARALEVRTLTRDDPHEDYLAEKFDPGLFSAEPEVGAAAAAEFNQLVEHAYGQTGDWDASRKAATEVFGRSWGVTRVGRKRLMKHPPEIAFAVPGMSDTENAEWQKEQLDAELSDPANFWQSTTLGLKSEYQLVPHIAEDGMPSYTVMLYNREKEIFFPLVGWQWRPDWATSPAGQRQAADMDRQRLEFETAKGEHEEKMRRQQLRDAMGLKWWQDPDVAEYWAGGKPP